MKSCIECHTSTTNPKFCTSSCAATHNNRLFPKRSMQGRCMICGSKTPSSRRYCTTCRKREWGIESEQEYIKRWLAGRIHPRTKSGQIPTMIRRYLLEQCKHACPDCGWAKINSVTGKVPLTVDHRGGNCNNNSPDNVRILCPSCHSLAPNYGRLNKKSARSYRCHYRRMKKMDAIAAGYPARYTSNAME